MQYLICEQCRKAVEVRSRYLTFCPECGVKLNNSFSVWSQEHPGASFGDYQDAVCQSHILKWEPQIQAGKALTKASSRWITAVASALLFSMVVLWAWWPGREVVADFEHWALQQIRFNATDTDLWQTTLVTEGNFQVKFPSAPKVTYETAQTIMGPLPCTTYRVEPNVGGDENLGYAVSFITCPPGILAKFVAGSARTEEFLVHSAEALAMEHNGRLVSQESILYGLFPGREMTMVYGHGMAEVKSRIYLVDKTLYMLRVTSAVNKGSNKSRDFFLNSFKLLEYAQSIHPQ